MQQSVRCGAGKRVSGASERANRQASDPILTSLFLFVPDHSEAVHGIQRMDGDDHKENHDDDNDDQTVAHHPPRTCASTNASIPLSASSPSACEHRLAWGRELCYLCHQREKRNVPIYLDSARLRREREEDRVLQQVQRQIEMEAVAAAQQAEAETRSATRKRAEFNRSLAEKNKETRAWEKETEFFADAKAFVLRQRPPTPDPQLRRQRYGAELSTQIAAKERRNEMEHQAEEEREKRRRRMLMEELAKEREAYLTRKWVEAKQYDEALRTQMLDR